MAEGLRGDLGQVTAAHAGLYRQISEVSDKLTAISADARTARLSADAVEGRLTRMEREMSQLKLMLALSLGLLAVMGVLAGIELAHGR